MRLKPGSPLYVELDFGTHVVNAGRLALDRGTAVYEPAGELGATLRVNPFFDISGLVRAKDPRTFDGLHGVFADSLPDAWGQILVSRRAAAHGIAYDSLTALDKLAIVGGRGMGALRYRPEFDHTPLDESIDLDILATESLAILQGESSAVLEQIEALGGSSGGARPKVLVGMNEVGDVIAGQSSLPDGYAHWIVKFRHRSDLVDIGPLEAAYADMAHAAGIVMTPTRLLPAKSGPGYFATQRFDRVGTARRLHVASAAGLLDADWDGPGVDADMLLKLTWAVTRQYDDVEKMFARIVFNVAVHNRDDHAKQHAFLMDERGTWRLAPAYDLTYSRGPGGEHYLAVNGKGNDITRNDLAKLADAHSIPSGRANEIIDGCIGAASSFSALARERGVSTGTARVVRSAIDAQLRLLKKTSRAIT